MNDNLKQRVLLIGSLMAIGGALFALYQTQYAGPKRTSLRPHIAIGEVLAEEVARLVGGRGRVVIVTDDLRRFPAMKAEVASFQSSLRKQGNLQVAAVRTCRIPSRAAHRSLPSGDFLDLLRDEAGVDAIVSFVGVPPLDEQQMAALQETRPKVAAVCRVRTQLGRLMDRGVVQVAIVPRFVFPAPVSEPKTSREWFDKFYQVVKTAAEAGTPP